MGHSLIPEDRLLQLLAAQLQVPLMHISQVAELKQPDALEHVATTAEQALILIDSFLNVRQLPQQELLMEPVTLSSVLYDVAQTLQPVAKQYSVSVDLHIDSHMRPVMADRRSLQAALTVLGQSYISAAERNESLLIASYRSSSGIKAGMFGAIEPFFAGRFIAQRLIESMATRLSSTRHLHMKGFAATFSPSTQLRLV